MRKIVASFLISASLISQVVAQVGMGGAAPPPSNVYALFDNLGAMNTSTAGKTSVATPTFTAGDAVFLILGQSLCVNVGPTPYTVTHTGSVLQLDIYNGIFYQANDPLIGTGQTGGSWMSRLGDKLITDGKYTRVILVPACTGSTAVLDWSPSGILGHRTMVAFKRIRQSGLPLTGVLWEQGQQDVTNGTSSATWQARFAQVRGIAIGLGYNVDWLVAVDTMTSGATSATIQAAQAAVVDGVHVFAGPNVDTGVPDPASRQADHTHPNDAGEANLRDIWAAVIEAHF